MAVRCAAMLVPRNVDVLGTAEQVADLVGKLRAAAAVDRWEPAHDQARKVRPHPAGQEPLVFQHRDEDGKRALLWFFPKGNRANVGNIVPLDRQKLDPSDYNELAASFVEHYLRRVCEETGCRLELGPEERTAGNMLSGAAMRALESFSNHANKGTGNSHPDDARRWADFVIQCFRDKEKLSFEVFREWMRTEEWTDSMIEALYDDLETGLEVLQRFEETR